MNENLNTSMGHHPHQDDDAFYDQGIRATKEAYYFDKIHIGTELEPSRLEKLEREVSRFCKVHISSPPPLAVAHGYKAGVTLYQAPQEAITALQDFKLKHHGINAVVLAHDVDYEEEWRMNEEMRFFQCHATKYKSRTDPLEHEKFIFNDCMYLGAGLDPARHMMSPELCCEQNLICEKKLNLPKSDITPGGISIIAYPLTKGRDGKPVHKILDGKFVYHKKIRFGGSGTIKNELGINGVYQIGNIEELYKAQMSKWLVMKEVNPKRALALVSLVTRIRAKYTQQELNSRYMFIQDGVPVWVGGIYGLLNFIEEAQVFCRQQRQKAKIRPSMGKAGKKAVTPFYNRDESKLFNRQNRYYLQKLQQNNYY